jgi:hypothetical protein
MNNRVKKFALTVVANTAESTGNFIAFFVHDGE